MSINITWTGVDGSVWDLTGGTQGVILSTGVGGLNLPAFTQQVSKAARVPGQRYLGTVYDARSFPLTVHVGDVWTAPRVGADWLTLDAAWWASLSAEATGRLTVTTSNGGRSLACRLASTPDPAYPFDPSDQGSATYPLTLSADKPFWTGPDITVPFPYPASGANYYGGGSGTKGPPFTIGSSSALANATITNPGDRPAYLRYVFTGPGTPWFEINGHRTTLPTLGSGQVVSIDTNPLASNAVQDISSGGSVDFWPFMGAHDFWIAVPPKTSGFPIPMGIASGVSGASGISVTLTPQYMRAW